MVHSKMFLFLLGSTLLLGCKEDEAPEPDLGYGYFPTKVGTWVEYQVDSLWRDDVAGVLDSVSYRLLERIMEHYTDDEGRTCQRIHRFVKDENDAWVVRDVWTSTSSSTAAERTEENFRRLKLSFPVRNSRTWDMNVYNTERELSVAYRNEGEPWSTDALNFERTVLVKNTVGPNFIEKRNFEERYAKEVGMVSKYWEETNTQVGQFGQLEVRGWRLDMVAVAYGVD
jgi:hypothetical protein